MQGFNATTVWLADIVSFGGKELFDGLAFTLANDAVDFTPLMNPGGMELQNVVLQVAQVTKRVVEPAATKD